MKQMKKIVLIVAIASLMACDGNKPTVIATPFVPPVVENPVGQGLNIDNIIAQRGSLLSNVQTLVPIETVAGALDKSVSEIIVKDASPRDGKETHSSCFFKWSDFEVNNAGILIQIMANPLGEEYPDYVPKFIESKRTLGEQDTEGEKNIFKTLQGLGDDGAYSYEAGKYFWRLGDKVIMSIAFNSAHSEEDQYRIAQTLGKIMTENYIKN